MIIKVAKNLFHVWLLIARIFTNAKVYAFVRIGVIRGLVYTVSINVFSTLLNSTTPIANMVSVMTVEMPRPNQGIEPPR